MPPSSATTQHRKRIGIALMAGGIVPWVALMAYIVAIRHPSPWLIAITIACWATFFIGKTLIRARPGEYGEHKQQS